MLRAMYETALRHHEAGRFAEAVAACGAILNRMPRDFLALRLLGLVHSGQGAFDQAAYFLTAALAVAPTDTVVAVATMNELAAALMAQRDFEGALDCYRRALARRPDDAVTLHNYGNALVELNRHAEALEQYRAALAVTPESADLRLNEAVAMLALGCWPDGWERLEARLSKNRTAPIDPFPPHVPHWRGKTDVSGKTILLQAEQGLGDTLQFVRYVPMVAALGARVVLRVQPVLGRLLARLPGAERVLTFYDPLPELDVQCPLMSLPHVFGTGMGNVPADVPYLQVAPDDRMVWQALLGKRRRPRIGVAWWGRQHLPLRSMPLKTLAPLLARSDVEFHALQQEMPAEDRDWLAVDQQVVDRSADLKDFADTAALVSLMDLVVTVDTSVAHLAGGLGVPVWIMLRSSADCRWLLNRADTPWYPNARLFRQKHYGDWDGVVGEVVQALPFA